MNGIRRRKIYNARQIYNDDSIGKTYLANTFVTEVIETTLTYNQQMEVFLRSLGDPGFQLGVGAACKLSSPSQIICLKVICKVTCGWCYSKACLVGKTAIITGGNSGIGYQTALSLASRGCKVIIADKDDSSHTRDTIINETGNSNIFSKKLDLRSFKSVRAFAQNIIDTEPKLHILINNAGIGSTRPLCTEDGLQETMQVNYYSHFLLTHLLLDLLKKSAPSRIIFTSSAAAFVAFPKIEDLKPNETTSVLANPYASSKLCEIIAANEFAKKLKGTGVTANSLHPGGVCSNIFIKAFKEDRSPFPAIAGYCAFIFGKNCEQGAQTLIYLACAKEVETMSGKFFVDCLRFVQPVQTYRKEFCKSVWDTSMTATGMEKSNQSNNIR